MRVPFKDFAYHCYLKNLKNLDLDLFNKIIFM